MDINELYRRIIAEEEETERAIERERKAMEERIKQVRMELEGEIARAKEEARKEAEKEISRAEEEARKEAERIIAMGQKEIDYLLAQTEPKKEKAVEEVMKRLID